MKIEENDWFCFGRSKYKMNQNAQIKLSSTNYQKLDNICLHIKNIIETTGIRMSGPILVPTKKLIIPCRNSRDATWIHRKMYIHKRLIQLEADERALRQLIHIPIPKDVHIEIVLR